MTQEQNEIAELEATYGPLATHSEYKRGEIVTYRDELGAVKQGEILWVCPAGNIVGRHVPMQYIIAASGFPSIAHETDILEVIH